MRIYYLRINIKQEVGLSMFYRETTKFNITLPQTPKVQQLSLSVEVISYKHTRTYEELNLPKLLS